MFLRQAPRDYARDRQDRLTLRRTVEVRLGTNPGVPRDGCIAMEVPGVGLYSIQILATRNERDLKYV
ncbi:MAG: hypothetical protein OEU80_04580 [Deltaproteobacteria bacterium]|nr:hypothetical protein [Deltaproteobacteria bacterium]MDH3801344.1 hypothetical protein [Deltaproteobacteria bacterium]MDH3897732.1 hypothetical protein [Deltaproteobacteria bacterium]MDH3928494.1 hypothetical protein [Deltaproteobacteria bacterium]MDH3949568.1 hypothetical protein [Deltaproteobacteria bacterium]